MNTKLFYTIVSFILTTHVVLSELTTPEEMRTRFQGCLEQCVAAPEDRNRILDLNYKDTAEDVCFLKCIYGILGIWKPDGQIDVSSLIEQFNHHNIPIPPEIVVLMDIKDDSDLVLKTIQFVKFNYDALMQAYFE